MTGNFMVAVAIIIAACIAGYQADRALDLWYCHASAGYSHQQQLDECLATKRSAK